jgi:hypothetical protein
MGPSQEAASATCLENAAMPSSDLSEVTSLSADAGAPTVGTECAEKLSFEWPQSGHDWHRSLKYPR